MSAKVLVVDDEEAIRDLLKDILEEEGYTVVLAANGKEGIKAFFSEQPTLVIIDILMPEMDGWTLLDRIREVSEVPVIFLTALGRERDKIRGLRNGADDYVVKPISRGEFLARVTAALRKAPGNGASNNEYKDAVLHVDFQRHQVYLKGNSIELTPQEFRLLSAFVRNPNVVLSADQLLNLCWGEGLGGPENVRVYIGYLRKKIEEDPSHPELIETVREFGYRYIVH